MKTVAIIGTRGYPSHYGGFETAVRKLVPYLVQKELKVRIYCRHGETTENSYSPHPFIERVFTRGLKNVNLNTLTHGLYACLHSFVFKPDVALIMNVANGFWIPLLKMRGIPTIVNVDGMEWQRSKWNKLGKKVFYSGAIITSKLSDYLIADSKCIKKKWNELFSVESEFIPYGGELNVIQFEDREDYILYVARLVPENSIMSFLDSISLFDENIKVRIVGSKSTFSYIHEKLKEVIQNSHKVEWLGQIRDEKELNDLWRKCAIYFHGHTVGGTNPALVQAMSSGAPIIAIDTIFNREVLENTGIFVQNCPVSIAKEINSLFVDIKKRETLSTNARLRASQNYTWESVNSRYFEIINSAIQNSNVIRNSQ